MKEAKRNGRFLVMALDLDDSVKIFGVYESAELALASISHFEKIHWRFSDWRVQAWEPALDSGR
ncbi:hypothetical protein [Luteolibacter soli]|uniref:Uncharacterized protein n=1 Tax=Luteolibacter soli TaxID=3135280 RepID=A0ABU9AWX6_9BACT